MLSVLSVIKGNMDVNSSPWVIIALTFMSHILHHPFSPLPLPSLFLPPQSEPPFYSHAPHLSLFKSKLSMGQCIFLSLINFTPVPSVFLQIPWFHFSSSGWIKFHFIHPTCFLCLPICHWPPRVSVYLATVNSDAVSTEVLLHVVHSLSILWMRTQELSWMITLSQFHSFWDISMFMSFTADIST